MTGQGERKVSEMKAGRELNVLVAEKVMGWGISATFSDPYQRKHTVQNIHPPADHCGIQLDPPDWDVEYRISAHTVIPAYSTDIVAAWQVVDRMHERGLWMRLQSPFEANDRAWNAGFTEHSFTGWNGRPEHTAQADTAPLAICLAALKAVAAV